MKRYIVLLFLSVLPLSCEEALEEEVFSQLAPSNFLSTREGIDAVTNDSYRFMNNGPQTYMYKLIYSILTTGIADGQGGGFEQNHAIALEGFIWNTTTPFLVTFYDNYYKGIRNANIIIDELEEDNNFSEDYRSTRLNEAKAIRAYFYFELYKLYGTVPLITSSTPESLILPRASEEDLFAQIESDLLDAVSGLTFETPEFGRMTKGSALGLLCKFYLNTRQWQKCVDTANEIINSGQYTLLNDFTQIYDHENEQHTEILFGVQNISSPRALSTNIFALITPPDIARPSGITSYGARVYVPDEFINTYEDEDIRKSLLPGSYVAQNGNTISGFGMDRSIILKYPLDSNGAGDANGIDFIAVRYADILLSKAESLNELNGPTTESVDLINQVRTRSQASQVAVSDFSSTDDLNSFILDERLREFYLEGMEREDLIRHEVFISRAIERGINAQPFHRLFPIPLVELDANPLIENVGY